MTFSMKDLYPSAPTAQMTTNDQTIPENSEESEYINNETAVNSDGQREVIDKQSLWGAIILFIGVMFLVHFI